MYRQALFPEPLLLHGEAPRLAGGNGCGTGRVRAVGYAGARGYGPRSRAISTSRSAAGCAAQSAGALRPLPLSVVPRATPRSTEVTPSRRNYIFVTAQLHLCHSAREDRAVRVETWSR